MKWMLLGIGPFVFTACAHAPAALHCEIKLQVDPEISKRGAEFCTVSQAAVRNVANFAAQHRLEKFLSQPIVSKVEVLKDRARLEQRFRETYNAPPDTKFPPGLSAGNDAKDVLWIMPEEEALKYSLKFNEPGFYEKLATHELIHLLHIRMVDGKEDQMGPIWFFEGFPAMAARQLEGFEWPNFRREYIEVIRNPQRGDYRKYAYLVRRLAKKVPIAALVSRARNAGFDEWAIEKLK